MKKIIYYAILQEIEVDDNMSDTEIDALIAEKANGKDCIWSENNDLF